MKLVNRGEPPNGSHARVATVRRDGTGLVRSALVNGRLAALMKASAGRKKLEPKSMNALETIFKLLPLAGPIATVVAAIYVSNITRTMSLRQIEIANNQAVTSENKLKLDLFDKSFEVFSAARRVAEIALMNANPASGTYDKWTEFIEKYNKAIDGRFLFDPATYEKIKYLVELADEHLSSIYRYQKTDYSNLDNFDTSSITQTRKMLSDAHKALPEICAAELRLNF